MRNCWKTQPTDRPSFSKLVAHLQDLKDQYKSLPHVSSHCTCKSIWLNYLILILCFLIINEEMRKHSINCVLSGLRVVQALMQIFMNTVFATLLICSPTVEHLLIYTTET